MQAETWQRIEELESLLKQTDYIVVKLAEYKLLGRSIDSLLVEYIDIINERDMWRNELENLRGNAS